MRYISRSSHAVFRHCMRKGFYNYLAGPYGPAAGLEPAVTEKPLALGISWHKGGEVLMKGGSGIEAAQEALKEAEQYSSIGNVEKQWLLAASLAWERVRAEEFHSQYDVLGVEEEVEVALSPNVVLQARADAVVQDRNDGTYWVWNWKCQLPDSMVDTYAGEQKRADEVVVGDELLGEGSQPVRVIGIGDGGEQPCVEVVTTKGRIIRCSANHPFLVHGGWIRADSLGFGDELTISTTTGRYAMLGYEARLLGYLVGDGGLTSGSVKFSTVDKEIEEHIYELWPDTKKSGKDFRLNGAIKLVASHGLWGKRSSQKFVPQLVMQGDEETTKNFLGALFDCDGSINLSRGKRGDKQPKVTYYTNSRKLSEDVQLLLTRLGIPASIWKQKNKKYKGKPYEFYWVYIQDTAGTARFAEVLLPYIKKNSKRERLKGIARMAYPPIYDTVKEVRDIGMHRTIAIETSDSHTIVMNSIVTHNTASDIKDWNKKWFFDIQAWTEALAMEGHMGVPVAGCIFEGIYKGPIWNGNMTSRLVYGYKKLAADGEPWYSTDRESGYQRFNVWEESFPFGEGISAWVNWLPRDFLRGHFVLSAPQMRNDKIVEAWLRQLVRKEADIDHLLSTGEQEDIDAFFEQNFGDHCARCPYVDICMMRAEPEALIDANKLRPRVDHHAKEEKEEG